MRFQIIVLTDYMNVSQGELNFISLQLIGIHVYFIRIKQNRDTCKLLTKFAGSFHYNPISFF